MSPRKGNRRPQRRHAGARPTARRPGAPPGKPRPGALFDQLVALQARLRSPRGCPWDREQTHESLRTYLVEETYEVLDALDSGDDARLASELGDLLLQIVFHAQLAAEAGRFDIADVIKHIHEKMVRRHPHVFGAVKAKTAAQVLKHWEQLKVEERQSQHPTAADEFASHSEAQAREKGVEPSILDGVPRTLPALLEAYQLTRRAAHIGFDWSSIEGLLEKLVEETTELRHVLGAAGAEKAPALAGVRTRRLEEEAGDLLFVAVNVARFLGVDPEIALKKANRKFVARFRQMEREAARTGKRLAELSAEELEALWEAAKGLRQKEPAAGASPRPPA